MRKGDAYSFDKRVYIGRLNYIQHKDAFNGDGLYCFWIKGVSEKDTLNSHDKGDTYILQEDCYRFELPREYFHEV